MDSGLNFLDVLVRQGVVNNLPKPPYIMGLECAGEVEAVGEDVEGLQVGDKVAALADAQAWAELTAVPAQYVYKLPQGMSPKDAAGILLNYTVAHILVHELAGGLSGGSKVVLVHSAGGAVGLAIAHLAKLACPDVVLIGIASKHKHEAIKDHYSHLLEHGSDYVAEVKKISPAGVDVVLDCSSGDDTNKGHSLLKPLGKYIIYGRHLFFLVLVLWWQVDKVSPLKLYDENKSLSGLHLRHLLYKQDGHQYVRSVVDKVWALWEQGSLASPVVDSVYALEDVTEGMQKLHERKNVGKIVLDLQMEPKPKPQTEKKSKNKDKEVKAAASIEEPPAKEATAEDGMPLRKPQRKL
ncbi:VAT1L [Cordylochernes scorpioides]|uniref:VAT1L n=1 Tax=Cordylochernes scorpioides TaxID=51811 RepID=A0ABY6JVX6_9ARAC|nr:VAT1L [Cordylochernes scorpioides]